MNDTSNNSHVGCFATMDTFHRSLFFYGYEIIRIFYNRDLRTALTNAVGNVDAALRACDIVVINAEGSLHSGRSYELSAFMKRAREAKKPYFVLNAFIDGDETIFPLLADAEAVTARDAESARLLSENSISGHSCLDASIFAQFGDPKSLAQTDLIGVTDWHGQAPVRTQRIISNLLRSDKTTLLPLLRPDAARVWRSFGQVIASHSIIACARYHGAIFAAMSGTPFVILNSNSSKMLRLAKEYGLSKFWLDNLDDPITQENLRNIAEEQRQQFRDLRNRIKDLSSTEKMNPLNVLRRNTLVPVSQLGQSLDHLSIVVTELENLFPTSITARLSALLHLLTIAQSLKSVPLETIRRIKRLQFKHCDVIAAVTIKAEFSSYAMHTLLCELLIRFDDNGTVNELLELRKRDLELDENTISYLKTVVSTNMRKQGLATYAMGLAEMLAAEDSKYSTSARKMLATDWAVLHMPAIAAEFILKKEPSEWNVNENRLLWQGGHLDEALNRTRVLLQDNPGDADANTLFGELNFVASRFDESWKYLRLGSQHYIRGIALPLPREEILALLASSDPFTVVFEAQYGVGTATLMMSVLADVVQTGRPVFVQADPRLKPLFDRAFSSSAYPITFLTEKNMVGPAISMISLGMGLRRDRADFPGRPLVANSKLDISTGRPRIGLTWSTPNNYSAWYRNLPDHVLVDLATRLSKFYDIVSLEIDPEKTTATLARLGLTGIVEVPEKLDPRKNIEAQLDLINGLSASAGIDCSSSIFSAALGKPTFVFKSTPYCWLWPDGEANSIFFENLRFISRPVVDEWNGQVDQLVELLVHELTP